VVVLAEVSVTLGVTETAHVVTLVGSPTKVVVAEAEAVAAGTMIAEVVMTEAMIAEVAAGTMIAEAVVVVGMMTVEVVEADTMIAAETTGTKTFLLGQRSTPRLMSANASVRRRGGMQLDKTLNNVTLFLPSLVWWSKVNLPLTMLFALSGLRCYYKTHFFS